MAAAFGAGGCGASLNSIYEGDVRFEHCMALDAQPSVKPGIRRACWTEWVRFYTYGQTRDRVVHAQLRIRQLGGVSDFVVSPAHRPLSAVSPSESGPEAVGDDRCTGECRAVRDDCRRECATPSCEKSCSVGLQSCLRRCG